jgi:hypothetical protein
MMDARIGLMAGYDRSLHDPILSLVLSLVPEANLRLRNFVGVGKVLIPKDAPVAQLDRAFDYESKGRTFESCRAHHFFNLQQFRPAQKSH